MTIKYPIKKIRNKNLLLDFILAIQEKIEAL